MSQPKVQNQSGSFLVVLLLLLGVAAGMLTVTYWSQIAKFVKQSPSDAMANDDWPTTKDHTPEEISQVEKEFLELSTSINEAMKEKVMVPANLVANTEAFVETHPDFAPARTLLGHILVKNGLTERGYKHWIESLKIDSQQAELHLLAGTLAIEMKDLEAAEQHYRDAVNINPLEPRFHVHLSSIYNRKREFDKARDSLLRALRLNSDMHEAHWRLAEVFARQNKLVSALTQGDKAIETAPENKRDSRVAYIRFKAKLLRRDNKPDDALHTLIYNLTPEEQTEVGVIEDMANCMAMQSQFKEAAVLFERQMKLKPFDWQLAAKAAAWRIKSGDMKSAKRHIETVRRIDPRQPVIAELEKRLK